jgi:hypothetical protein
LPSPGPRFYVGRLLEVGSDSLTAEGEHDQPRQRFARSDLRAIDVSTERRSNLLRGIGIGAGIGTAVGALGVATIAGLAGSCDGAQSSYWCADLSSGRVLQVLGAAAASGALLGAELALKHPRDVWTPAIWPTATRPFGSSLLRMTDTRNTRRGFNVGIQLAF